MINFPKALFSISAIFMRQYVGGRVGGFVALLHALSAILLYTLVVLFLRGFLVDTTVGGLLAVPVLVPMLLFAAVLALAWFGRALGMLRYAGPLRLDGPNDGFTGAAGDFLRGRFRVEHEWTLLERYEPSAIAISGVVLAVLPWTRVLGVFLLLVAVASAWQSTRDRRANAWDPNEHDDFAEDVVDDDYEVDEPSVSVAFDSLGKMVELIDDDEEDEEAEDRNDRVARDHDPGRRRTARRQHEQARISVSPGVSMAARGPISVHSRSRATIVVVALLAALVGNFLAGDFLGLYDRAPKRWVAGVQSVQSAGIALGLAEPASEQSPGGLTDAFLRKVDSGALKTWKRESAREVIAPARASVEKAESAVQTVRLSVSERTGMTLSVDSHTELFDQLLLDKPSVREAWAALLNGVDELDALINEAEAELDKADTLPERASLDTVRQIQTDAEAWTDQAEALHTHIEHIGTMLDAKRLERALDSTPEEDDGG